MAAPPVAVKAPRTSLRGACEREPDDRLREHPFRAPEDVLSLRSCNDGKRHLPVFTLVHRRLMMRWVAGSRAVITNSFFSVASSG